MSSEPQPIHPDPSSDGQPPRELPADAGELARLCARLCDEKKATDIAIFDIQPYLAITDYFVIATGRNRLQLRTISEHIRMTLKEGGVLPLGREGYEEGTWILLDYSDVVIHLFQEDARRYYDLDLLWGDAPRISWQEE